LAQIFRKDETLVSWFCERFASYDRKRFESSKILEEIMEMAFNSQQISYVILDGLDECDPEEAEKALSWFLSHQNAVGSGNGQIRLLCTGQRTDILQRALSSAASISLDNQKHHERDIEQYVEEEVIKIREKFNLDSMAQSQIVSRVTKTANGLSRLEL
jgi:hypothetical protein